MAQAVSRTLVRFFAILPPGQQRKYFLLLVLMIGGGLLEFLSIGAVPAFVAILVDPAGLSALPVDLELLSGLAPERLVFFGAGALLLVFFLKNAFLAWTLHFQYQLVEEGRIFLSDRLFQAWLRAPFHLLWQKNSSELTSAIHTEARQALWEVVIPFLSVAMSGVLSLFTFFLLFLVDYRIGLGAALFFFLISGWYLQKHRKKVQAYGQTVVKKREDLLRELQQFAFTLPEVRILGRENYFLRRFDQLIRSSARAERNGAFASGLAPYITEVIVISGLAAVVVVLLSTRPEPAQLLPLLALVGAAAVRLKQNASVFMYHSNHLEFGLASLEKVLGELEQLGNVPAHIPRKKQALTMVDQVEARNLSFQYPERQQKAVASVSLSIPAGSAVAFVGATGSGKTTLLHLLTGLLEADSGSVRVDGRDIRENPGAWLQNIGYVPQTVRLLDGSIRSNIALGIPEAEVDETRLLEVIREAELGDWVLELPQGVATRVGEQGIRLSGGQRQRLGLARALYHQPSVLVLDEATSALDVETEKRILQSILKRGSGRTVIAVTHRVYAVMDFDQIIVLKNGRIAGSGRFKELLLGNAQFQELILPDHKENQEKPPTFRS